MIKYLYLLLIIGWGVAFFQFISGSYAPDGFTIGISFIGTICFFFAAFLREIE